MAHRHLVTLAGEGEQGSVMEGELARPGGSELSPNSSVLFPLEDLAAGAVQGEQIASRVGKVANEKRGPLGKLQPVFQAVINLALV